MFPNRIFTTNKQNLSQLQSVDSFMNSNLRDEIRDIDSKLTEETFNINLLHSQSVYYYLKENSLNILEEGMTEFLHNVKDFFIKLKDTIIKFVKKAVSYIQAYTGSFDKYLETHKEELKNFKDSFEYENGYNYTFSEEVPYLKPVYEMIDDFNKTIMNPEMITSDFLDKQRSDFFGSDIKPRIRSKILKSKNKYIDNENFIDEVKKVYRNNKEASITIHIDEKYVNNLYKNYMSIKADIKKIVTFRDKLVNSIDQILVMFKQAVTIVNDKEIEVSKITIGSNKTVDSMIIKNSNDNIENLNNYYNLEFSKFSFMYNCIYIAYFEKINAMKECLVQYANIAHRVITGKTDNMVVINEREGY